MRIELIFTAEIRQKFWSAVALPNYAMFHVFTVEEMIFSLSNIIKKNLHFNHYISSSIIKVAKRNRLECDLNTRPLREKVSNLSR